MLAHEKFDIWTRPIQIYTIDAPFYTLKSSENLKCYYDENSVVILFHRIEVQRQIASSLNIEVK